MESPETLCRDADRARARGHLDRAVRLYERALTLLKTRDVTPPSPRVAAAYENVAVCERARRRLAHAVAALEACVRWDDRRASAWSALGETCMEMRRTRRAVEAFEKYCERCDAKELGRGRELLRRARTLADERGWRGGEGGSDRRQSPRRESSPRRTPPWDEDDVGLNTVFTAILHLLKLLASYLLGQSRIDVRGIGLFRDFPSSVERDTTSICAGVLLYIVFSGSQCPRLNLREQRGGMCEELCRDFRIPQPFHSELCSMWNSGFWFPVVVVVANVVSYAQALNNPDWSVGPSVGVTRKRLVLYQFAHGSESHLMGNMLTLLAISSEISRALGCDQVLFALLYFCSGWCGGLFAGALGRRNSRHIGASGSISGVILALCVLRPHQAVVILGTARAARPWLMLLGTLAADLTSHRPVSWEGHLGGGFAGAVFAWFYAWFN